MRDKNIKEEAKSRTRRKKKTEINSRIWLVGSRKWKDKRSVKKVLSSFDYQKVDFVLLGMSPGLEQLALSVCRQLKFNVILLPPNVTRDSYNATYFRNATMFHLLKPTHVFGFDDDIQDKMHERDVKLESQTKSTIQLLKLARAKKVEHQLITTKRKSPE
jgi:hypothetical protein